MKECVFVGAALGWGAQRRECQHGPEALFLDPYFERYSFHLLRSELCIQEHDLSLSERFTQIAQFNTRLAHTVYSHIQEGVFPVVLGGDHSVAIGTWSGVKKAINAPVGLIWVDAHMDSHTPLTTPSNAIHGMPLAALLGVFDDGHSNQEHKEPVLLPEHVVLIGIRSYEEEEKMLLQKLGVTVIEAEEVHALGLDQSLEKAKQIVKKAPGGFGISFDFDFLDPEEFTAVGSPERGGFSFHETQTALQKLTEDPSLQCLEIVEYNPTRDSGGRSHKQAIALIDALTKHAMQPKEKHELFVCSQTA